MATSALRNVMPMIEPAGNNARAYFVCNGPDGEHTVHEQQSGGRIKALTNKQRLRNSGPFFDFDLVSRSGATTFIGKSAAAVFSSPSLNWTDDDLTRMARFCQSRRLTRSVSKVQALPLAQRFGLTGHNPMLDLKLLDKLANALSYMVGKRLGIPHVGHAATMHARWPSVTDSFQQPEWKGFSDGKVESEWCSPWSDGARASFYVSGSEPGVWFDPQAAYRPTEDEVVNPSRRQQHLSRGATTRQRAPSASTRLPNAQPAVHVGEVLQPLTIKRSTVPIHSQYAAPQVVTSAAVHNQHGPHSGQFVEAKVTNSADRTTRPPYRDRLIAGDCTQQVASRIAKPQVLSQHSVQHRNDEPATSIYLRGTAGMHPARHHSQHVWSPKQTILGDREGTYSSASTTTLARPEDYYEGSRQQTASGTAGHRSGLPTPPPELASPPYYYTQIEHASPVGKMRPYAPATTRPAGVVRATFTNTTPPGQLGGPPVRASDGRSALVEKTLATMSPPSAATMVQKNRRASARDQCAAAGSTNLAADTAALEIVENAALNSVTGREQTSGRASELQGSSPSIVVPQPMPLHCRPALAGAIPWQLSPLRPTHDARMDTLPKTTAKMATHPLDLAASSQSLTQSPALSQILPGVVSTPITTKSPLLRGASVLYSPLQPVFAS